MKFFFTVFFGFFLCLTLAACSPLAIINSAVYEPTYQAAFNIAYGPEPRQALDVYAPPNAKSVPVIVFVHGGSWRRGDKSDYKFLAETIVRNNAVAVIVNYRRVPQVVFPSYVEDAAKAVAWTVANVQKFGGDSHKVFLMGHSAGAHIASLVAYDPSYLQAVGLERSALRGFIGLAGPYDFLDFVKSDALASEAMGGPQNWERSQPILNLHAGGPPALLLHGLSDDVVNPKNAPRLTEALKELGTDANYIFYKDMGHEELVGMFSKILQSIRPETVNDVMRFVSK